MRILTANWAYDSGGSTTDTGYTPNDAGTHEIYLDNPPDSLPPDGPGFATPSLPVLGWGYYSASVSSGGGSSQASQQTQLMLAPTGQQQAGMSSVYLVCVNAATYADPNDFGEGDEELPVSPETLQLNGQTLVNNGVTNGDGTIQGLAMVTGRSGATVPLTVTGPYPALQINSMLATNVTLQIIDNNTGNVLSGQTNSVIVGQQMNLSCQLNVTNALLNNAMLTNFQWTVPGYAISNYVVASDSSSAMVVSNFPTTNSSVIFYWVDGATNRSVWCSATVDGVTISNQAVFNVLTPSADLIAFTNGPIAVNGEGEIDGNSLHWGDPTIFAPTTNYGIAVWATNIALNGCSGDSTFLFVQTGMIQAEHNYTNGTSSRYTGSGLDSHYPASSFSATEAFFWRRKFFSVKCFSILN